MDTFDYDNFIDNMVETTSFTTQFLEDLLKLVTVFKCPLHNDYRWLLGFCTQKVDWDIKNSCNVPKVPEGLYKVAAGMILAEYLSGLMTQGVLSGNAVFNFDGAVKQLQEGDTNIVFAIDANMSGEGKLNSFIEQLRSNRNQFITYRRLKW